MFSELAPAPLPTPPAIGVEEYATAAETTVDSIVEFNWAHRFKSPDVVMLEFFT